MADYFNVFSVFHFLKKILLLTLICFRFFYVKLFQKHLLEKYISNEHIFFVTNMIDFMAIVEHETSLANIALFCS